MQERWLNVDILTVYAYNGVLGHLNSTSPPVAERSPSDTHSITDPKAPGILQTHTGRRCRTLTRGSSVDYASRKPCAVFRLIATGFVS
jgi:hypothetical protein